ncbi:MAG: hypothetical protein LBT65_10170 [Synergistaceae bacterium]|jgi:hypothetical protein|nr:hypothetical protein [Synergistaceae bacterium]
MRRVLALAIFFVALASVSVSAADVRGGVERIFELNAKLKPGMSLEALNELLGPPAGEHRVSGGTEELVRYSWLHGEMGIEIYCMRDAAYSVSITLPLGSDGDVPRALDALMRKGQSQYGAMPGFDRIKGEYYWTGNGFRFGFLKYNSRTVRSTCTVLP